MKLSARERDRELDWLRQELVEDLRLSWARDDRWAPWKPDESADGFTGWTAEHMHARRMREDHNSLMRSHVRRIRALDEVRAAARSEPDHDPYVRNEGRVLSHGAVALRAWRHREGLSQQAAAVRLRTTQNRISLAERGGANSAKEIEIDAFKTAGIHPRDWHTPALKRGQGWPR